MLIIGIILVFIVFIAAFFKRWNIPLIVIALGIGIFFGSDVTGLIYFDNATLTKKITDIALMFVLFAGGFETKKEDLKIVMKPALILATVGVLVTALVGALIFTFIFKWDFITSLLLCSIISSTDASAVFSILRSRSVDTMATSITKVESATNDPMAIILTAFVLQLKLGAQFNTSSSILIFLWSLVGGIGFGCLIGYLGKFLFNKLKDLDAGYYHLFLLGLIFLSFGLAQLCKASGMMAVFFSGFILGNTKLPYNTRIASFTDTLSFIANVGIYVLLGLLVFPSKFPDIWLYGVMLFLIITFIARPVTVFLATYFSKLSIKENIFLSWSGIRGTVPIILATYPIVAGIDPQHQIFNIVFIAVILSILFQGTTIGKLADILKLNNKKKIDVKHLMELVTLHNIDYELIEIFIDDEIYEGECKISDLNLPSNTTITMINRNNEIIAPSGQTTILPGDVLFVLVEKNNIEKTTNQVFSKFFEKKSSEKILSS